MIPFGYEWFDEGRDDFGYRLWKLYDNGEFLDNKGYASADFEDAVKVSFMVMEDGELDNEPEYSLWRLEVNNMYTVEGLTLARQVIDFCSSKVNGEEAVMLPDFEEFLRQNGKPVEYPMEEHVSLDDLLNLLSGKDDGAA